jgi:hypothetical protein
MANRELIRYQEKSRMRIPGGITPERFARITNILRTILNDIERAIEIEQKRSRSGDNFDYRPKELHIRLNESGKPFPLPIFAGWVESTDVRRAREAWNHPDPGLHRFGDDIYSEIYGEALNYAGVAEERFRYRNWAASELLEKRAGEKATDPKAGNLFQTCLAIVAKGRAVGTLVVGFKKKPPEPLLAIARRILGEWARGTGRNRRKALLNFLNRFDLGGPLLRHSNWWKLI